VSRRGAVLREPLRDVFRPRWGKRGGRYAPVGCVKSVPPSARAAVVDSSAHVDLPRSCSCSCRFCIWRSAACSSSSSFALVNRVQGAGDRRATASAGSASSAGRSAAADDDRSCLPGCCESVVAALALAVVPGHADSSAALAPAALAADPRAHPGDSRRHDRRALGLTLWQRRHASWQRSGSDAVRVPVCTRQPQSGR
jgi:hypothetical protein